MRKPLSTILIAFLLFACGGDDDDDDDVVLPDAAAGAIDSAPGTFDAADDTPDAAPGAFALTSTAYSEGGAIPIKHSCDGDNVSPALTWTGGPGAAGYGIVFTDNTNGLIHSVIWDIPGSVMSLPEDVEKVAQPSTPAGSKQTRAWNGSTIGYEGPCPGTPHTYEFIIYSYDTYPLPGVILTSSRSQVETALQGAMTDSASLSATYTP